MTKQKFYQVEFKSGNQVTVPANSYSEAVNYCIDNLNYNLSDVVDANFVGYDVTK